MDRLRRSLRFLRVRVPATAMAVFAVSLAVAAVLAYELLLQDGRRDIDIVIAREQERFALSMSELLADAQEDLPGASDDEALRAAVTRYLQLNPATPSYWAIVTFADGHQQAAANGPPELEPLFHAGALPQGRLNVRETIPTEAGDVRTATVPILLGGDRVGTLQIVAPLAPVRAEAMEAAGLVAAAAGVSLLLGGILLAATLWRSLAPLGQLAATARNTNLRSLDARVDEPDGDDEVGLLAREFNTMLARLAAASDQQREFMASIGHELRTPITIARGHLEVLESVGAGDRALTSETVAILQDELRRMGRLVEDLMAIARSGMDDFARRRPVELVHWFEELELRLSGTPSGRQVRIQPPPPVTLQADPDRLAQAVLNLVSNAEVHTPPGTDIRVEAGLRPRHVVVAVHDDGPGIPEEIRDQVFAPFVRAGEAPSSTGLGLSVVKAVVDAHDGEVVLDTGAHGTRIELLLPWQPAADETELLEDRPREATAPSVPAQPPSTTAPVQTLVPDTSAAAAEQRAPRAPTSDTLRLPREADDTLPTLRVRRPD
ncbi:ATP-binding protein [Egicoccus sp. AB-alg6-2]|uniref:HAMP domain-containing sensor histidine kinase n=1 Tax=Egicoccus sp. AB-alg6-2 TaxID=3242692 RepID=UPI00359D783D